MLAEAELARAHRVLAQERLRIARELHDVVAHSITVITVQAAFGRLVADDAAQAKDVLGTIETAGRRLSSSCVSCSRCCVHQPRTP